MNERPQRPLVTGWTIDGPTSLDLDDAILLEKKDNGWLATISISDVAAHVLLGSETDARAQERGFTRYFAQGNDPMLSRDLSESRLSLLPRLKRDTVTFYIELTDALEVAGIRIEKTVLKTKSRMSHQQVDMILDNQKDPGFETWSRYYSLAEGLLNKRRAGGALVIYDFKRGYYTNEEGQLLRRAAGQYFRAYVIVQEFMILANTAVSAHLLQNDVPMLFRNHAASMQGTDPHQFLAELYGDVGHLSPDVFADLSNRLRGFLGRAKYQPVNTGHIGLNVPVYAHWTSPIRRYADLVNHRVLTAWLAGEPSPYTVDQLAAIGEHLNILVERQQSQKSGHYKSEAQRLLQGAGAEEITALEPGQFSYFVELIVEEHMPLTRARAEALSERIQGGRAAPVDFARILFVESPDDPLWREIKENALQVLLLHPDKLVQVANVAEKIGLVTTLRIQCVESRADGFEAVATVERGGRTFSSEPQSASSKRDAEREAVGALLIVLNGFTPEAEKWSAIARSSRKLEAQSADNAEVNPQATSAVNEICQRLRSAPPTYDERGEGESHKMRFFCRMQIVIGGVNYVSDEVTAMSKKDARHRAAANLLSKLPDNIVAPKAAINLEIANPVSRLQEYCQTERISAPSYDFKGRGPSHAPVFHCICVMILKSGKRSYEGVAGVKNDAKKKAAQAACKDLL